MASDLTGDKAEIQELAYKYGRGLDGRDEAADIMFDECLIEDVEVVYEFGSWRGVENHKEMVRNSLKNLFTFTHHVISNPIIKVSGDTAVAEYKVTGPHGLDDGGEQRVIWGGSVYRQECVRTPAGWRIKRHECDKSWIADDGGLMARVAAGFANG